MPKNHSLKLYLMTITTILVVILNTCLSILFFSLVTFSAICLSSLYWCIWVALGLFIIPFELFRKASTILYKHIQNKRLLFLAFALPLALHQYIYSSLLSGFFFPITSSIKNSYPLDFLIILGFCIFYGSLVIKFFSLFLDFKYKVKVQKNDNLNIFLICSLFLAFHLTYRIFYSVEIDYVIFQIFEKSPLFNFTYLDFIIPAIWLGNLYQLISLEKYETPNSKWYKKWSALNIRRLFISVISSKKEEKTKTSLLLAEDDKVISKNTISDRHIYAESLCKELLLVHSKDAFSVGILGKWGAGKSYFLQLMKKELEGHPDAILIDFHPWKSSGEEAIIRDFFNLISKELYQYNNDLAPSINSYLDTILQRSKSIPMLSLKWLHLFLNNSFTPKNANEEYETVKEFIKNIDKPIFIFIDDLDRLDGSEVIGIIKLIRNVANFEKVIFVCAYDRGYVINAIKKHLNEYQSQRFLEKIFQLEITLPVFDKEEIMDVLIDILREDPQWLNSLGWRKEWIEKHLVQLAGDDLTWEHLTTIRDIIRFSNLFKLDFQQVFTEVDPNDFYWISLLKLRYPDFHSDFFAKRKEFITIFEEPLAYDSDFKQRAIDPPASTNEPNIFNEDNDYLQPIVRDYLSVHYPDDENAIWRTLLKIFSINKTQNQAVEPKKIRNKDSFYNYFSNQVFTNKYSFKEVEYILIETPEKDLYTELIKINLSELKSHLLEEKDTLVKILGQDYSKLKTVIVTLLGFYQKSSFDIANLIDNDSILESAFNNNLDEFKQFLIPILEQLEDNLLIGDLMSKPQFKYMKDELENLHLERFKKYTKNQFKYNQKETEQILEQFLYSNKIESTKGREYQKAYKELIIKDFHTFFRSIIYIYTTSSIQPIYTLSAMLNEKEIKLIFNSFKELKIFISANKAAIIQSLNEEYYNLTTQLINKHVNVYLNNPNNKGIPSPIMALSDDNTFPFIPIYNLYLPHDELDSLSPFFYLSTDNIAPEPAIIFENSNKFYLPKDAKKLNIPAEDFNSKGYLFIAIPKRFKSPHNLQLDFNEVGKKQRGEYSTSTNYFYSDDQEHNKVAYKIYKINDMKIVKTIWIGFQPSNKFSVKSNDS